MPLLLELLDDEDQHIQIDAIEAFAEFLTELPLQVVEEQFVPCVLVNYDVESEPQIDVLERLAELTGKIANVLSTRGDLHLKYKKALLEFYLETTTHKED